MIGIKTAAIFAILVAQCLGQSHTTSAGAPLRDRIPSPDRKLYEAVESAKDWKNPFLIVRRDGIEVVGVTHGRAIVVESVLSELEDLPASTWPYGLVVAVQENGVRSNGDARLIAANRTRLIKLLKRVGIAVENWPSA